MFGALIFDFIYSLDHFFSEYSFFDCVRQRRRKSAAVLCESVSTYSVFLPLSLSPLLLLLSSLLVLFFYSLSLPLSPLLLLLFFSFLFVILFLFAFPFPSSTSAFCSCSLFCNSFPSSLFSDIIQHYTFRYVDKPFAFDISSKKVFFVHQHIPRPFLEPFANSSRLTNRKTFTKFCCMLCCFQTFVYTYLSFSFLSWFLLVCFPFRPPLEATIEVPKRLYAPGGSKNFTLLFLSLTF